MADVNVNVGLAEHGNKLGKALFTQRQGARPQAKKGETQIRSKQFSLPTLPQVIQAHAQDDPVAKERYHAQLAIFERPYHGTKSAEQLLQRVDLDALDETEDAWPTEEEFSSAYRLRLKPFVRPVLPDRYQVRKPPPPRTLLHALTDEQRRVLPDVPRQQALLPMHVPQDYGVDLHLTTPGEVYVKVCQCLGVVPLAPLPEFGRHFYRDGTLLGGKTGTATGHAFAIAAALHTYKVESVTLKSTYVSDAGIAKIIQLAGAGGDLKMLHVENNPLDHQSLHALLGLQDSWQLDTIKLPSCGLGGCIDDAPSLLHEFPSYQVYEPSLDLLLQQHRQAVSTFSTAAQQALANDRPSVSIASEPEREEGTPILFPLFKLARRSLALRVVDLSSNQLSSPAWQGVCWMVQQSALENLNVSNCNCMDEDLRRFAGALAGNKGLKDLALRNNPAQLVSAVSPFLAAVQGHPHLAHLDYSENRIPTDCVPGIASMMDRSQTLMCLHLLALDRDVGVRQGLAKAFSWPVTAVQRDYDELVLWRAFHLPGEQHWRPAPPVAWDGCWVCAKHQAVSFAWGPESGPPPLDTVMLLPSFRTLEKVQLERQASSSSKVTFTKLLHVPPGRHHFVFEVSHRCCLAADVPKVPLASAELPEDCGQKLLQLCQKHGLTEVHFCDVSDDFTIPDGCVLEGGLEEEVGALLGWGPASKESGEHEVRMRACFEHDLLKVKLHHLSEGKDQQLLEQVLWSRYTQLVETYAICAGRSSGFPCIRKVDIYDFFELACLLERDEFSQDPNAAERESPFASMSFAEVQQAVQQTMASVQEEPPPVVMRQRTTIKQKATNQHLRPSYRVQEEPTEVGRQLMAFLRAKDFKKAESSPLTRASFIELVCRVAVFLDAERFLEARRQSQQLGRPVPAPNAPGHDHNKPLSVSEAVLSFIDYGLRGTICAAPLWPFKKSLLWCQEVQVVFYQYARMLRELHNRYGKSLQSFLTFAQLCHLYDKTFTAKDVRSVFALSKTQQREAPTKPGPTPLRYDEFLEALARCALVRRDKEQQRALFEKLEDDEQSEPSPGRVFAKSIERLLKKIEDKQKAGRLV